MKIFENKFWVKLIAAICLILTVLNVAGESKAYAKEEEQVWGGVLITPIVNLLTALGDSIMEGLHTSIQSQRQAIIRVDSSEKSEKAWALFGAIVLGILVAAAFIALAAVGAAGVARGALFGAAGLALGIASGDPSKALQYAGAGAMGGYGAGKGLAGSTVDTLSVDTGDIKEEAERVLYGEDYAEHKYEEIEEANLMSESNIAYYRDVTGGTRSEAKEFLRNQGKEYYQAKVTDIGDMLATEETIKQNKEREEQGQEIITQDEAIAATRLKKSISQNVKDMSYKKEQEYWDTYRRAYEEKLKKQYPEWENNEELAEEIKIVSEEKADKTIRIMKTLETNKSDLTTL